MFTEPGYVFHRYDFTAFWTLVPMRVVSVTFSLTIRVGWVDVILVQGQFLMGVKKFVAHVTDIDEVYVTFKQVMGKLI